MYETLDIERAGGVTTVWMNRPSLHNAFNATAIGELTAAFRAVDADADTRVMVLAGRGKSFSAGADVESMRAAGAASEAENVADALRLAGMFRTLAEMATPTIARVHGAAIGGGMGLVGACDICVASDHAVFATSEVRLGIIPAAIAPYVIRAIGERQALRYFLTAERIRAERAVAIGLAHEAVAEDRLDATVAALAEALALGGPAALSAAKDLVRAVVHRPVSDALLDDTARRIARQRATAEARDGLSAFLDKRPAAWTLPVAEER
jgi:methylglutaconyl-CoA hydratase